MSFVEIFLIGVGLSMDAFAVAICKGLGWKKLRWRQVLVVALSFGGFQALMPFLRWAVGRQFWQYIVHIDHWIAMILLAFIGGKMVLEGIESAREADVPAEGEAAQRIDLRELFWLAVATSIDALAVGITFSFLEVAILPAVSLIGVTTFCISAAGVLIGNKFGGRLRSKAEAIGGVILILIGLKILIEHLMGG